MGFSSLSKTALSARGERSQDKAVSSDPAEILLSPFLPAVSGSTFKDSYTRFILEETALGWKTRCPTGELRNGAGAAKTQITSDLKAYRRNTES